MYSVLYGGCLLQSFDKSLKMNGREHPEQAVFARLLRGLKKMEILS